MTPQPIHIFRKDVLHLWPETLVVLLLYVALAWSAPSRWTDSESQIAALIPLLGGLIKWFLLPVAWLVVIARLIHDEPLVGDRQFWTSRPYHWFSLFLAKVLYLVTFLYLPFLLMQIYLLKRVGLYPTTAIPELLHNLLLLTVIVVIPIAALSAVTSTMMRALLSFVGTIIFLLILFGIIVWAIFSHMTPPQLVPVITWLFVLLPLSALIVQYATRRTAIARGILIGTPLFITLLFFIIPGDALIRYAYPVATVPKLGPLPDAFAPKEPEPGELMVFNKEVSVGVPFAVSDADKDSEYVIEGLSASIQSAGISWSEPYVTSIGGRISPGIPYTAIRVTVPLKTFNQIGHVASDIHLSIPIEQLKAEKPSTWKATKEDFAVPGHGLCSFSKEHPDTAPECRYPFKAPDLARVTALVTTSCSDASASKVAGPLQVSASPQFLDFDPVVTGSLKVSDPGNREAAAYHVCPGTDVTFTEGKRNGKTRLEVDAKQLVLENYATHIPPQQRGGFRPQPAPEQP
jgi:hypothetical protein